ncbi:cob(I)yrinic acid a,c-diamide adenosyltransferase [Bacillota bacterium LX-D]|nr:cob(I)yrinic acid a,c-diamide adenosyltransferase [Bacillota bacterium LX-D]
MSEKLEKGLIQVYTGNGKGKSTAAFGLALRALGCGLDVVIIQFMKTGIDYGEIKALDIFKPKLTLLSFGRPGFISRTGATEQDIELAQQAMEKTTNIIQNRPVDLLILDEINNALYYQLLETKNVLNFLEQKPERTEIVLTGRHAPEEIIVKADLVTEMLEIKHPYKKGIRARKGIEY